MEMIPKVLQAVAGHLVYIYFHDGTVRLYDASPCWKKRRVRPPAGRCHLSGTIDSPQRHSRLGLDGNRDPAACIDLDPCELYESCPVVEGPPQRGDLTAALACQKTSQHQTSTGSLWDLRRELGDTGPSPLLAALPHIHSKTACRGFESFCPAKHSATAFAVALFFVMAVGETEARGACRASPPSASVADAARRGWRSGRRLARRPCRRRQSRAPQEGLRSKFKSVPPFSPCYGGSCPPFPAL